MRKGSQHVLVHHMSRIPNVNFPIGVEDDLLDAPLSNLNLVPEWSEEISHCLANGFPKDRLVNKDKARRLIKLAVPYQLIEQGNCTNMVRMESFVDAYAKMR